MTKLKTEDRESIIQRYTERFERFGYDPKALGWDKGKQDIRFEVLTGALNLLGKTVLDIGCGFGDIIPVLEVNTGGNFHYIGVDVTPSLVYEARARHCGENITFIIDDFLNVVPNIRADFAVASGVFNHKLAAGDEYGVIAATMAGALDCCAEGISFDFLSDKVDYCLAHTFHSSPERILAMAYGHSRNVILRNDYMPFEFAVTIFKDDSFSSKDTVFSRYKILSGGR